MKVYIGHYPRYRWYHTLLYKWFGIRNDQRKYIKIDRWDSWSADHTLAEIILPVLIQLRAEKQGSPLVDDEDVPHLPKNQWTRNESRQLDMFASDEQDELFWKQYEERWNWVMDEMIYAFDCKVNKADVYMRFDDIEEARKEQDRIANGFRLFGKYYEGLWD